MGAAEHSESGLVVLVQSDYQSVVRPARQLGPAIHSQQLLDVRRDDDCVSLSLWYIVVRMFREPTAGLQRPATPVPESTAMYEATTMTANLRTQMTNDQAPNHKQAPMTKHQ